MSTGASDIAVRQEQQRVADPSRKQAAATQKKKVAIVHDWLIGGGAEKVVLELHRIFPEAPIYTSFTTDEWQQKLDGKVVTGYLQHWPFSKLRKYLPVLRAIWFSHLKLDGYEVVISSSGNGEAKGIKVPEGTKHICYCHSPVHFYWRHYDNYLKSPGFGIFNPLARFGLRVLVGPLRHWDLKSSKRPGFFIANSTQTQKDIKTYYNRDSVVINPPVDIERFSLSSLTKRNGFVTVGRLIPHKRVDVIVAACSKLNLPLTVVGRGPELTNLKKLAGPNIKFDDNASDEQVVNYLNSAEAFLFASHEDFGIAPVEAMAAGTPVIAYKAGGALDYVNDKTGLFFENQTTESLMAVLKEFDASKFNSEEIKKEAAKFSAPHFHQQISEFISRL